MLRLDICSKSVLVAVVLASSARAAGLSGQIDLVRAAGPARQNARDASGVVLWLEPVNGSVDPPPTRARMIQKNKTFTPHILAISKGTTVDFPNFDPIFHNAFSNFNGQVFDIGLYPPGKSRSVTFRQPGIVRVFCNIHPNMSAVILVLDTPYFAVSDRNGRYSIPDVPPGSYKLRVFDERATPEFLDKLGREVEIGRAGLQLASLQIKETAYIPLPHLNKFGKPYPPGSGADSAYSLSQ